jgi:DNA-binding winged helix-turn-helix (wHTH) protein
MAVTFSAFTLDRVTRQLLCAGRAVAISPKAFELLALLVEKRPAAVSKADIHARLWPDAFVSDGNLTVVMAELRDVLGDDARHPSYLRTLHRFGYSFIAPASDTAPHDAHEPRVTHCWLLANSDRAALWAGDNVVGRGALADIRVGLDATADLRMDGTGVSRRHALLVVRNEHVTLQDLSSKNGTFLDDVRVGAPVVLEDGAWIRLGPLSLHYRRFVDGSPTQTQGVP